MKVRFWGTRGSLAKPGSSTLRYGGNTPCVEVRTSSGTLIVIDCGTGIQGLGQDLLKSGPKPIRGSILISHTHWDHIQGFPFFAPLFIPGNEWDIYGPRGLGQSLRETLAGQMQYTYFPITLDAFGSTIRFHDLVEGVFPIEDALVHTQYLNHPALTLAYRVEADGVSVVHASDHEPFQKRSAQGTGALGEQDLRHAEFVSGADLVIHDAQYTLAEYQNRIGWGHSTVEYAINVCRRAGAKRLALTHHDPLRSDAELEAIEREAQSATAKSEPALELFAAAEGMTVELNVSSGVAPPVKADEFSAVAQISPAMWQHSILVCVTDSEIVAQLTEASRSEGIELTVANTADAIADSLLVMKPSLLVIDEKAATDRDLCAAITSFSDESEFPIVAVVNQEVDGIRHATDWLVRPFSVQYLRTRIRAWVLKNACRWKRAPIPHDEEARLAALRRLKILYTGNEDRFDRITRLAASLFNVRFSLVSLVDHDREFFKSCYGYTGEGAIRDASFCSHAILKSDVMVVPDTLLDDRFADHPAVVEEPRVRFYAGCPLTVPGGHNVGTLCVFDTRPREFDAKQKSLLRDLGQLVEQELSAVDLDRVGG